MLICFSFTYFLQLHIIYTFCLHDTDTVKFENLKVKNSIGLKYKFYKAILKVSSFWRGLDNRYNSEEENSRGTLSHHH